MNLHVIACGGTFDKHYDEIAGKLDFGASHLTEVIRRSRIRSPITLQELPLLDSLIMQDDDRQLILAACIQAEETHIVIVHGTDSMRETAEVLGHAGIGKTIVLTGAMIPYEIANSDAFFNFGFACGVLQNLDAGVYVAMNGQVFEWDKVEKNYAAGIFQAR